MFSNLTSQDYVNLGIIFSFCIITAAILIFIINKIGKKFSKQIKFVSDKTVQQVEDAFDDEQSGKQVSKVRKVANWLLIVSVTFLFLAFFMVPFLPVLIVLGSIALLALIARLIITKIGC
ncbi:hypothetical protein NI385_30230 (plasmid) [Vibrio parahaemolyticus]|uniref:hypothetical protein n=1 Tax=Vibrio TaxID=662 RepID=UPI0005F1CC1D|nr:MULTISPECIES: hypothetical protein [Vibrio]EJG0765927.1 hypothetical protein [Vibrio parahaemolyticus O5:K30]TVN07029.1 hypothetical protein FPV63_07010 [Vibrio cholerae]EGR2220122.1 hypothetical protein [Vibrio parahaemolyticus]MBE4202623.1 hypothetical protein [Vibrio parahaemolyticus]MDG2755853.1 hypothetical protein [Vibrio parahaemolyticus]